MRGLLAVFLGLVAGAAVGGGAMLLTAEVPQASTSTTATAPITTAGLTSVPATEASTPSPGVLLVWTPGRLPDGFPAGLAGVEGVSTVSVVATDLLALTEARGGKGVTVEAWPVGMVIPLEVSVMDRAFADLAPAEWQEHLANLAAGTVLLSESSATLRGVGLGGTLVVNDRPLTVVAVLPDIVIGGAEAVVGEEEARTIGVTTPRYALVGFQGDRAAFEAAVRDLLPPEVPVRVRAPVETPFLRNGDAVLPQALIKATFGEFAIDWDGGAEFEIDPVWVADNLVTDEVALIGTTTCHAGILPSLHGAMAELERANLSFLVDSFHGCFNPRFIGGTRSLSRHAWGVAVDINYTANQTGQTTTQDARLVEAMERWGFTWGGNWLVPDAAHFEWVEPPPPP